MAYVSEYGNYGGEDCLVFDSDSLTPEQWEELEVLPDYDKLPYVQSILKQKDTMGWIG